jgi:hypothetical protein
MCGGIPSRGWVVSPSPDARRAAQFWPFSAAPLNVSSPRKAVFTNKLVSKKSPHPVSGRVRAFAQGGGESKIIVPQVKGQFELKIQSFTRRPQGGANPALQCHSFASCQPVDLTWRGTNRESRRAHTNQCAQSKKRAGGLTSFESSRPHEGF